MNLATAQQPWLVPPNPAKFTPYMSWSASSMAVLARYCGGSALLHFLKKGRSPWRSAMASVSDRSLITCAWASARRRMSLCQALECNNQSDLNKLCTFLASMLNAIRWMRRGKMK